MALSDNLIAYWSLDEASGNAIDAHSTYDLTENNTIGSAVGVVGNARDLESGSLTYFEHADDAIFDPGDTDFTFAGWMRWESATNGSPISKMGSGGARSYRIRGMDGDGSLSWQVSGDGTAVSTAQTAPISTATWYFVVAYHDSVNNQIGIVLNAGTPVTAAHSTGVFNSSVTFRMGLSTGVSNPYFDGLLDEWGYWGRVLSSAEITELYAGRDYAYITGGGGGAVASRLMLLGVG